MNEESPASLYIGIDIGGTFTDAVFFIDQKIRTRKTLTDPENPASGVLKLVENYRGRKFTLTHGSTLATNAVLQRNGCKTAFLATEGFSDLLHLARQDRLQLYSFRQEKNRPLVPRDLCFEVPERVDFMGDILKPVDLETVREILLEISGKGVRSLAVCLLFSFKNPVHEQKILKSASGLLDFVCVSSDVLKEYREYERASTTVLNAYVSPILSNYIRDLDTELTRRGAVGFKIMESGGGIIPATEAGKLGVRTILSGPAGGVAGAFHIAKASGIEKIITLDMGGTSTDVSLCNGGITLTGEGEIDGFPIRTPMVDIVTIGAGGGSIARVDPGGVLKVGPESAGADPGPAAFGKSGKPTVTDAHLVLGTISVSDFLGGDFPVDRQLSIEAVNTIAQQLGVSLNRAAAGIIRVAVSHMEKAMRVVTLQRGHDPGEFTLVPFGGAGPLHAPYLAQYLGIEQILIPRYPGVLSALGMLLTDYRIDFTTSVLMEASKMNDLLHREILTELYRRAYSFLEKNYFESARFEISLDLRYRGQSFEIEVPVGSVTCPPDEMGFKLPHLLQVDFEKTAEKFHQLHNKKYGFSRKDELIEIVNYRVNLVGENPQVEFPEYKPAGVDPEKALTGYRELIFPDVSDRGPSSGKVQAPVYSRENLLPQNRIDPPAVISQYDSTILVPRGWHAVVDRYLNLILKRT